jgi:WD40 repeat protein
MRHADPVTSVSFSPDGNRVVTSAGDPGNTDYGREAQARLWDAHTGQPLGAPMVHQGAVCSASFSPDGARVVTASRDFTAHLWDGRTGQPLGKPMRLDDWVNSASFSPDGTRVVTASSDDTARQWDVRTCQPDGRPMSPSGRVYSARYSPDGTRIVTASEDGTASVWDTLTGQPISNTMLQGGALITASFSPDGTRVLTASVDKTARLWDILPPNHAVAPSWLPDLAEAIGGLTISDSSAYVPVDPKKYFKLKAQLAGASGDDFWSKVGRWFFADRTTRTISPLSAITTTDYLSREAAATKPAPK